MALFESYERRIKQIDAVLAKYGIASIEEAKKICDDKGLDVYNMVKVTEKPKQEEKVVETEEAAVEE